MKIAPIRAQASTAATETFIMPQAFNAMKAALLTYAKQLGQAWGPKGIRVNCILPGPVQLPTDMPEAVRLEVVAATLARREGSPNHVAQAVLAFIDNDYLYGTCLPVDGGRTVYAPD